MRRRLAVFGSTGTIGTNTLDLAARFNDRFDVVALTAGANIRLLCEQIEAFRPRVVVVREASDARSVAARFPGIEVLHGEAGLVQCARWDDIDLACQGIVGFAALAPTLELVRKGVTVALANKETLVVAGELLKQESQRAGALVIPVDSEHNALYQLLAGVERSSVRSLVLTASGGPFWRQTGLDLRTVTPEMAIKHPNWKMGPKISVDSATLMNKGLEMVEAQVLFDMPGDQVEVWIHPQSIVHGAIWLEDGTCLAQLSRPDMRASIGHALGYPERLSDCVNKLGLGEFSGLEFAEPDAVRFPALYLPRRALEAGQSALIALNAANELAVEAFLRKELAFTGIVEVLSELLSSHQTRAVLELADIFDIDRQAREKTIEIIGKLSSAT